ncbi:MAG: zinc-ribbon domain-containing protein [Promethearchaeota archaeon]
MKDKDKQTIVKKGGKIYYPFCKKCGKEVKPTRRINNDLYYHIWVIGIVASLGIALPIFLIYHFYFKPKNYCPRCHNSVKLYKSRDKFPGSKAQIHRIVKEIDNKKIQYISCTYCHEKIDEKSIFCPICGTPLEKD